MSVEGLAGNYLLALSEDRGLPRDLGQRAHHTLVPVDEAVQSVRDADLVAEVLDELLGAAEVVTGHPRVQVVDNLELQAAVEEVQPLGTVDVHGGAEHLLGKGLVRAQVRGAHGEVGEADLGMERHGDRVADQKEKDSIRIGGQRLVDDEIAKPGPEEHLAEDFEVVMPPGRASLRRLATQQVHPRQAIEVEAGEGQNYVVGLGLDSKQDLGSQIVLHDTIIVGRAQIRQETVGDGEEGHVFNIGIVLGGVGDNMMDVVVLLPPTDRQATDEVGDYNANDAVDVEIVCDTYVASIVGGEDELMPKTAERDRTRNIPTPTQEDHKEGEQYAVTGALNGIGPVVAVIKAFGLHALIQKTVLGNDGVLSGVVQGGIFLEVKCDLFFRDSVEVGHAVFVGDGRGGGDGSGPGPVARKWVAVPQDGILSFECGRDRRLVSRARRPAGRGGGIIVGIVGVVG